MRREACVFPIAGIAGTGETARGSDSQKRGFFTLYEAKALAVVGMDERLGDLHVGFVKE